MFNYKRHKDALDTSQPFNPESVPGSTGIEKLENIAVIWHINLFLIVHTPMSNQS